MNIFERALHEIGKVLIPSKGIRPGQLLKHYRSKRKKGEKPDGPGGGKIGWRR